MRACRYFQRVQADGQYCPGWAGKPRWRGAKAKMLVAHRPLPRLNQVSIVSEFIGPAEHSILLGWAEEQFSSGQLTANRNGPSRYYRRYEEGDCVPDVFWLIRRRAISTFSIAQYEDEPQYKCFLGCNSSGGFIHPHTDPLPPDKHHIRMNIMLLKPVSGGYPVIDGKMLNIEERAMWCFFPTLMRHASTPVLGNRNRPRTGRPCAQTKTAPKGAASASRLMSIRLWPSCDDAGQPRRQRPRRTLRA